jgi:hypothetical protein
MTRTSTESEHRLIVELRVALSRDWARSFESTAMGLASSGCVSEEPIRTCCLCKHRLKAVVCEFRNRYRQFESTPLRHTVCRFGIQSGEGRKIARRPGVFPQLRRTRDAYRGVRRGLGWHRDFARRRALRIGRDVHNCVRARKRNTPFAASDRRVDRRSATRLDPRIAGALHHDRLCGRTRHSQAGSST